MLVYWTDFTSTKNLCLWLTVNSLIQSLGILLFLIYHLLKSADILNLFSYPFSITINTYLCTFIYATYVHTCLYRYTYFHTHIHTCYTCTHTYIYIQTCSYLFVYALLHLYANRCRRAYIVTVTLVHEDINAYI